MAVHKKGDKKILKNYRPVSLLAVAGMILEKVVALQIEEFFESNGLLGRFQFAFRRKKSTISEPFQMGSLPTQADLYDFFKKLANGNENSYLRTTYSHLNLHCIVSQDPNRY